MITLSCAACNSEITVDEVCADQTVTCPHCQAMVPIPQLDDIMPNGEGQDSGPSAESADVEPIASEPLAAGLSVVPDVKAPIEVPAPSLARRRVLIAISAALVSLGIVAAVGMLIQEPRAGEGDDIIADQSAQASEPHEPPKASDAANVVQAPPVPDAGGKPARTPEKALRCFEGHTERVNSVAFTPDGRFVLSGSRDKTLRIWDVDTGEEVRRILRIAAPVHRVRCDGHTIFAAVFDQHVRCWDFKTGEETGRFHVGRFGVLTADVSDDGQRMICSGGNGPDLWVWNTRPSKVVARLVGHQYALTCVALSRDGRRALSGYSGDCVGVARLWSLDTERELFRITCEDSVNDLCFTPDGEQAVVASSDGLLRLWNLNTGQLTRSFGDDKKRPVTCIAVSPNGRWALSGGADQLVRLWDLANGTEHPTFIGGHRGSVTTVAFGPDGKHALSGSADGTLRLWRVPEN